ncbi:response regulator transcription factor [Algisphaera agarilytica]|uniref:DNA-binding NarL/FixJ family response regulator n=1 Tax=Algisphaera agarilytica TaxID=1385975 RepID=A0A7X0H856_9BACT|nr:response regulator transcription factor [Algisphaera agarilytica]MBB6429579.1 DNA-binding NarL/FixJ family response regulator [Algisphaera agarilytica]
MQAPAPKKILIADDHTLMRETLRERLDREMDLEVVGSVASADEAVAMVGELSPDVVIMDVDMPGRLSFDAACDIVAVSPDVRLVFLSAFFSDRYIRDALAAHAVSYLTKDESPQVVVDAVRQAAQGLSYFSPSVRDRLVIGPDNQLRLEDDGVPATKADMLTRRELEMLRYLARGLSKKEIAATIHRSYGTVDKHVEKLMNKLDIHDRVELTRYAIREGLVEA